MSEESAAQPAPQPADGPAEELAEARRRSEEYLNAWKRTAADFENYQKRRLREDQELVTFSKQAILHKLLPVMQALEQAIKHAPRDEKNRLWSAGMDEIMARFIQALDDLGIEKIKTSGERFNHEYHEAVEMVDEPDKSGTIVDEVAPGYRIDGKVVQPAKVKVAR